MKTRSPFRWRLISTMATELGGTSSTFQKSICAESVASQSDHFFVPFDGLCDKADPAAVLESFPVFPLLSTLDAAVAAFLLVSFDILFPLRHSK